jgi:5-methylcytosine-specific restriction endonuclease McrA
MALKGVPVLSRRLRVQLTCRVCAKQYETHLHRAETSKYCSAACRLVRGRRVCLCCGTSFSTGKDGSYGLKYCSRTCSLSHMKDEKSPRWKDGQSLVRERVRGSGDFAKWRTAVKARDGNACVECGSTGVLHAHHIKSFADNPSLRTQLDNGVTLCVPCHSKVHGRWVGSTVSSADVVQKSCPEMGKITTCG